MLMAKVLLVSALVLTIVAAGAWTSWSTAQHVVLSKGRERGTMTVGACDENTCTGSYAPSGLGTPYSEVTVDKSVAKTIGAQIPVALKPNTKNAVRTGWPGMAHAWAPLAGALLLSALLIAGGLRMPRTAWATGLTGAAMLASAWLAL